MKVLIVGDLIIDIYKICRIKALCQEMAHPSLVQVQSFEKHGGAGLVKMNIQSISAGQVIANHIYSPILSKKIRIGIEELRQWVCRIDDDAVGTWKSLPKDIYSEVHSNEYDLVIISDYCKGTLDMQTAMMVVEECTRGRYQKPLLVDTRGRWDWYMGADFVFASDLEYRPSMKNYFKHVIHKAGAKGCYLDDMHIPPSNPAIKPFDVCGAGDVFLAAFAVEYLRQKMDNLESCCEFANHCAGISVGHWGTYVVKSEDL